jgi:3,4-dihydroxy-2-butanone 4-phosphate synthase
MTTNTSPKNTRLNTIEAAINDIRNGKVIIVVDDENRENEGDFLAAAEKVTPEMINFMATHGRGLICAPLTEKRCKELDLVMMVNNNTDPMETGFTVSVDLRGKGVTTGISASDRALTINALIDSETKPFDLKVLKNDLHVYIESDKEIIDAENKIVYLETTTKYIDYVLKSISSRGWDIKNAIEWKKFEAGMV